MTQDKTRLDVLAAEPSATIVTTVISPRRTSHATSDLAVAITKVERCVKAARIRLGAIRERWTWEHLEWECL